MTRITFVALVIGLTAAAAVAAALVAPGRLDVAGGVALGTGFAGVCAAIAVVTLGRIRSSTDPNAGAKLVNAFVGLMLARMVGYLAFLGGVVALGIGDALSVCVGLVGGTLVFQAMEVLYLRKPA